MNHGDGISLIIASARICVPLLFCVLLNVNGNCYFYYFILLVGNPLGWNRNSLVRPRRKRRNEQLSRLCKTLKFLARNFAVLMGKLADSYKKN